MLKKYIASCVERYVKKYVAELLLDETDNTISAIFNFWYQTTKSVRIEQGINRKIKDEVEKCLLELDSKYAAELNARIGSEKFLDEIIERIKVKQL